MTWLWALPLLSAVVGCVAWMIVSLKRLQVSNARTEQALKDCPPKDRAAVLEAAGKYASCLNGDRQENPLMRILPSRAARQPEDQAN